MILESVIACPHCATAKSETMPTDTCQFFQVSISKPTLSRELRQMGFRKLSARPRHHAQDEEAAAAFKKTFSPSWGRPPQKRRLASR
jgi:hypothetical protein